MIAATAAMEFVTVRTEAEALLLEANLIKRFRPRFNVLLRDDKSFPYILIARDHRGAADHEASRRAQPQGRLLRAVRVGRRRQPHDQHAGARVPAALVLGQRLREPHAALPAPSDQALLGAMHRRNLARGLRPARGRGRALPARREPERAAHVPGTDAGGRDQAGVRARRAATATGCAALAHVTADQSINPDGIEEADVFAAAQDGGQTCIQVFFFRTGQNWGNRAYFPKADRSLPVEEVLDSFIAQFYDDKPVPRLILISHDVPNRELLAEALSTKAERKIEIRVPQRGTKSGLVEHALANAREALGRKLAESSSQRRLLDALAERFSLSAPPRRIEVFDNSHIQGTNAVGGMIVAGPEGWFKGQYRKFNIKSENLAPGDDYAMMREVLTRRFRRLAAEIGEASAPSPAVAAATVDATLLAATGLGPEPADDDAIPDRPDLVLIDGGAGQLAVAREVLADLGLHDICVMGVAKGPERDAGREHFHLAGRDRPIMLEPRDPVLYFVQRLRDEAHRFAIGTHRAKRAKALGTSPLDEIAGIGPQRRRALMKHFGSAKAVSRAGVEDLKAVDGISAEMAQRIYDHFHEREG